MIRDKIPIPMTKQGKDHWCVCVRIVSLDNIIHLPVHSENVSATCKFCNYLYSDLLCIALMWHKVS